jgi:hypothetical protein
VRGTALEGGLVSQIPTGFKALHDVVFASGKCRGYTADSVCSRAHGIDLCGGHATSATPHASSVTSRIDISKTSGWCKVKSGEGTGSSQ